MARSLRREQLIPFALLGVISLLAGLLAGLGASNWIGHYLRSLGAGTTTLTHVVMEWDFDEAMGDRTIMAIFYVPRAQKAESVRVLLDGKEFVTFRYHPTMNSAYYSERESSGRVFVGYFPAPPGTHRLSASSTSGRPVRFSDFDWEPEPGAQEEPSTIEALPGHIVWVAVMEWEDELQVLASRRRFVFH